MLTLRESPGNAKLSFGTLQHKRIRRERHSMLRDSLPLSLLHFVGRRTVAAWDLLVEQA